MRNLPTIVIIVLLLNACAWKTGSNSETRADSLDVSTKSVASQLPNDIRPYFENGTNNAMRAKLIQLKNQYAMGAYGDDVIKIRTRHLSEIFVSLPPF